MSQIGNKYASILRTSDWKDWYRKLIDSSERVAEIKDQIGIRTALYLYLLYRDMYRTTEGDIEQEFIRLIDDNRINIEDDGLIIAVQYLHEDVPIKDYILLLDNSLVFLDIPTEQHLNSPYIPQLRNLKQILLSLDEQSRRLSTISYTPYRGPIPSDVTAEVLQAEVD